MGILKWIKRKITGRHQALSREQAERIARLPKDQARRELGMLLFGIGVQHASEFVQDDLRRTEAAFRGVPAQAVFHEMLALTFWIMDKELSGGKGMLLPELHEHYLRSYAEAGRSPEDRKRGLEGKYRRYAEEWDDVTGHQDEFGLCVAQNIFGTEPSDRTRARTFWIIRYAHEVQQDLAPLRKAYRSKFKPEQATAAER